jgi:hypothetical protein
VTKTPGGVTKNLGYLNHWKTTISDISVTPSWCFGHTMLVFRSHHSGVLVTPFWCFGHSRLVFWSQPSGVLVTAVWCSGHLEF